MIDDADNPESEAAAVRTLVEETASDAIRAGDAQLTVTTVSALYGPGDYDCPVVVLTPANSSSAQLRIEVQDHGDWYCSAGDGPGLELHGEASDERVAVLRKLIRSVVEGRYEWGVETRIRRGLLRPWRREQIRVRIARFFVEGPEPLTAEHWPSHPPEPRAVTRFAPYRSSE